MCVKCLPPLNSHVFVLCLLLFQDVGENSDLIFNDLVHDVILHHSNLGEVVEDKAPVIPPVVICVNRK